MAWSIAAIDLLKRCQHVGCCQQSDGRLQWAMLENSIGNAANNVKKGCFQDTMAAARTAAPRMPAEAAYTRLRSSCRYQHAC